MKKVMVVLFTVSMIVFFMACQRHNSSESKEPVPLLTQSRADRPVPPDDTPAIRPMFWCDLRIR